MPLTKDGYLYTGYKEEADSKKEIKEKTTNDLIELTKPTFNKKLKELTKQLHFKLLLEFYDHLDFSGMIEESSTRTEQDIEDMINRFLDERNN